MKEQLEELKELVRKIHEQFYLEGNTWKDLGDAELVDHAYLLKQFFEEADEIRKEVKRRHELMCLLIAKRCTEAYVEDPTRDLNMKGETCIATPDVKMSPKIPKHGTPEFAELCEHFGVNQEAVEAGLLRPHWPSLTAFLTAKTQAAESFPPGIVRVDPVTTVTFRKRRTKDTNGKEES